MELGENKILFLCGFFNCTLKKHNLDVLFKLTCFAFFEGVRWE